MKIEKVIDYLIIFLFFTGIFVAQNGIYNDAAGSTALTSSSSPLKISKTFIKPVLISITKCLIFYFYY